VLRIINIIKSGSLAHNGSALCSTGMFSKSDYGEPTTTLSCRVPVSKKIELAAIVAATLKRWLKK
jgi:hypothetical protein